MASGPRWRRLSLGCTVGVLAMAAAFTGSAPAALKLDNSTDTSLSIDGDVHWWSGIHQTVTMDGYQFIGHWDAEDRTTGLVYLTVTRRRLSDGRRDTIRFDQTGVDLQYLENTNDGHNFVGVGLSPNDGVVHLSYSNHIWGNRDHNYLASEPGCMTTATFTLANCRFGFSHYQANRTYEDDATYPTYFNDSRGRLYFTYRHRLSHDGEMFMNSYNDDGTWTDRGRIMRGRNLTSDARYEYTFDPDGAGPAGNWTSRTRGIYAAGWEFDKNDRLHVAWAWREDIQELPGNHGVNYAYSNDYGRTWRNNAGTRIATAESDPITILDLAATEVVPEPNGWFFVPSGMELDSNNNPHVFGAVSDTQTTDTYYTNSRQAHWWRATDGTWYAQFVEGSGDGAQGASVSDLMLDGGDNVYALFTRRKLGWVPWQTGDMQELSYSDMTWQGGEYLDIQLRSRETAIDTTDRLGTSISTSTNKQIRVRMRNNTDATDVAFYWTTESDPTWSVTRGQTFRGRVNARDRNYTDYVFEITNGNWTGALRQLEFYPALDVDRGSVSIDSIDIYDPTARTVAKSWHFREGHELFAAEAGPGDNWRAWTIEKLLPGIHIPIEDGPWRFDRNRYRTDKVVEFPMAVQGAPGTEELTLRQFDIVGDDVLKDWQFTTDAVGWTAVNHVSGFRWADDSGTKGVTGSITGNDSALVSMTALDVPIDGDGDWLHVVMKNTSNARRAGIWFQTNSDRTWTAGKSTQFTITANSGYTEYDIDMSRVSGWDRSTLYQLELDPIDDGTTRGSFAVDRIWIDDTR